VKLLRFKIIKKLQTTTVPINAFATALAERSLENSPQSTFLGLLPEIYFGR
jgi:hypothetical protein